MAKKLTTEDANAAITGSVRNLGYGRFKEKQKLVIVNFWKENDVFMALPTLMGKAYVTFAFQAHSILGALDTWYIHYIFQQVWYADDETAAGSLTNLLTWWQNLTDLGPKFGYSPNATKSILLVKPDKLNVNIMYLLIWW